jgi:hypothetical protein
MPLLDQDPTDLEFLQTGQYSESLKALAGPGVLAFYRSSFFLLAMGLVELVAKFISARREHF